MAKFRFNRVLLKLSGEALKGAQSHGYDADAVRAVVATVKDVLDDGAEVAIVVGAGNIWRGAFGSASGMDPANADYMGMLATAMNALALKEFFQSAGIPVLVQSAIGMEPLVPRFDRDRTLKALEAGQVVVFAGGSGCPFFTTDTASVLRALETNCDAVLKATKVDGVYSADPKLDPAAERFEELSFDEALDRRLKVMDAAAFSLCRDHNLPIVVFNFSEPGALRRVMEGDPDTGTVVC